MAPSDTTFITKDSGERKEFGSGMHRDSQEGKSRHELVWLECMPYEEQMLTKYGELRDRGAKKYGARNCELACTQEEHDRFKASACRHFAQLMCGETDEDHRSAVIFNLQMMAMVEWKLKQKEKENGK